MKLSSERIVALKLHGLHQEDREWIVSQLDPSLQSRLMPLLDELKELGFEMDPDFTASIGNNGNIFPHTQNKLPVSFDAELMTVIDSVSSSQLDLVFDQEPSVFLENLKVLHTWKWSSEVTTDIPGRGKFSTGRINADEPVCRPTAAVQHALLKAVAQQLEAGEHLGSQLKIERTQRTLPAKKTPVFQHFIDKLMPWKL